MPRTLAIVALMIAFLPAGHVNALVEFDFEQKFFTEFGLEVKDHSLIRVGSVYHLYYLRGSPAVDIGHATSTDLIHWQLEDPVLYVQPGTWDEAALWAPQVLASPVGGYIMYYTGVNNFVSQQTGIALADDPCGWAKLPWPVYHPDTSWALWSEDSWSHGRDPFVFYYNGLYIQLLTAKTPDNKGAIACGVSLDMFTWQDVGPLYVHDTWHVLESVQLKERNDKFYLFYTEEVVNGTSYMMSESLFGNWDGSTASLIDFGHAPEVNEFDPGSYVFSRHSTHPNDTGQGYTYVIRFDTLRWSGDTPYVYRPWPLGGDWNLVWGNAFLFQPTFLNNPRNRGEDIDVGFEGYCWLSSYERYQGPLGTGSAGSFQGDSPVGVIRSREFTITGNSMSLLVGGGDQPATCYVALVDADSQQILYKETGKNTDEMDRRYWDLRPYKGTTVYIEVSDVSTTTFGHISCDDIVESNAIVTGDSLSGGQGGKRELETVAGEVPPARTPELFQNSPNPFNPLTTITYHVYHQGRVTVDVFDVRGKRVRRLRDREEPPGSHHVVWNAKDNHSQALPSGIYFYRLVVDGKTVATRKMILLK
ncbi:MAG: family 43 glycosylhydrolase [Candidatus Latescibacterota bacterium]|nr:MAG: family 43 glycosylhydrolase [Candidatus Latescibacterota bacterium]